MRGKSSNASPGGLRRCGPPHETGLARLLHCGSVKIWVPFNCSKSVEWPIQVMLGLTLPARRAAPLLKTRGVVKARGDTEVVHNRRTTKLQRVQVEGRWKSGSGLRNPPATW